MPVPISQMWTVATYVLGQKIKGRKQYPLVLMLEPLFRCNLACAGCGKIQYPAHVLKMQLTPEECFKAVDLEVATAHRERRAGIKAVHAHPFCCVPGPVSRFFAPGGRKTTVLSLYCVPSGTPLDMENPRRSGGFL